MDTPENNRPFVLINVAMTVDGKLDTVEPRGAPISSARDKARVDRLRAEADAITVNGCTPHIIPPNPYNEFYLRPKAAKSGHLIDFDGKEHLPEQHARPIVEGMTREQIAAPHEAEVA